MAKEPREPDEDKADKTADKAALLLLLLLPECELKIDWIADADSELKLEAEEDEAALDDSNEDNKADKDDCTALELNELLELELELELDELEEGDDDDDDEEELDNIADKASERAEEALDDDPDTKLAICLAHVARKTASNVWLFIEEAAADDSAITAEASFEASSWELDTAELKADERAEEPSE